MGGVTELRRKLNDSYTDESYNTAPVQLALEDNVANKKDFLGRDFVYKKDTSQWPEYLLSHKKKYQHLCLPH